MNRKFVFYDFVNRQERMVKIWFRESAVVFALSLLALLCVVHPYAIIGWILVYLLTTISIGIMSATRALIFYRLTRKSAKLISLHSNEELKLIFRKSPRRLKWIFLLDIFYPVTWIISILFKLSFFTNFEKMKKLVLLPQQGEDA